MAGSLEDLKSKKFWVAVVAEFLGTLLLVVFACGSCIGWPANPPSVTQIALSFGFSVGSIVWAIAHVSGGHINPAVTFGFLVTRRISIIRSLLYIVAQSAGAIVGAAILKGCVPAAVQGALGTSAPSHDGVTEGQVFGAELLITFMLVFVVFATVDDQRSMPGSGPLSIGLSIAMGHLWAVPLCGAGTNPARVFGPAVVSGTWTFHWAYWVGPLIGGALAAWIYDLFFATNATPAKLKGCISTRAYDNEQYDKNGHRGTAANTMEMKA